MKEVILGVGMGVYVLAMLVFVYIMGKMEGKHKQVMATFDKLNQMLHESRGMRKEMTLIDIGKEGGKLEAINEIANWL